MGKFIFCIMQKLEKGDVTMKYEDLTQYVVEHMDEIMVCFDRSGIVTYGNVSARARLEYGDDLIGTHISEIFPNSFRAEDSGFGTDIEFNEESYELMAYRYNKTCFPIDAKFIDAKDGIYLCLAEDITRRSFLQKRIKQVEQDAEEAMKVKSEFVANVTHELRTPVNGLLGNTRELISRIQDEEVLRILDLMERGCNDMNALINNILDFSKLEAGKFTLEKREFDFRKMIDYVKSNHSYKITEKGLEFFVTISPEVPTHVIGDELRIVQVLNNLISNATKFTSVGKIAVEVVKTSQILNRAELFFLVTDTGIGISKENQDKLFKSFSQVDASISRKYGGTGLGLNISKQLVELMDGSIDVQSEPNQGTMFSFSIWVEIPEGETNASVVTVDREAFLNDAMQRQEEDSQLVEYGSALNNEEIKKNMSKLVLCIEMDNWEKAESFMTAIKQLTDNAPQEIRTKMLRLKMAVQKADYEKTIAAYEELEAAL